MLDDTIAALSTGSLPSGVAVVRLSGPAVREALLRIAGDLPQERRASLRRFRGADGRLIDRGIALFFAGPRSVTGEDLAEFHLHGGRAVVAALIEALTALPGVRLAVAGEFTRRAFENGRIDLTEAEGLADLLAAETEGQRRMAVAQAGGALRAVYEGWMRRLTHARAMIEASFDFADEGDVSADVGADVASDMRHLADDMRAHLAKAGRGEILREGYKVAIVGAPNAGKSSLLNALADREVAIVTEVPGTTRDVIEATLDLGGIPVRFSDTAGIRETSDRVEAIGVERARAVMASADLVLALVGPDQAPGPLAQLGELLTHVKHPLMLVGQDEGAREASSPVHNPARQILTIRTKVDLPARAAATITDSDRDHRFDFAISTRTGDGLGALVERIALMAGEAAGDPDEAVPVRVRHRELVAEALHILDRYLDHPSIPAEVAAETLRQAGDRLGALTGQVGVEDLLDVIFSEFCIGK
ncbi:tRNA uridine-5-carboxymethylaminomethyl(34) synthesis GTPase MnmE [Aurantimonas endophytica]|uniref:tRNA modification GTPase MnmE n=1 Tax=Aurantimonas endophytica TaxID=1522175 RepID=A0A7W6HH44_9HYPH|nr:tRNA uridine-5-carboxymethylaminomethyl(34) synthesis GTPase MnmE [Aurantimonas endophytica]MBB4005094.1 tRNA modification GTPase [Aurantimonas endophytica]MCO6406241.1 tRNA uridine-5-carboxymethylaminomethyl(34) synthesis GTPase MnmE [Aurantimonas endophytica]